MEFAIREFSFREFADREFDSREFADREFSFREFADRDSREFANREFREFANREFRESADLGRPRIAISNGEFDALPVSNCQWRVCPPLAVPRASYLGLNLWHIARVCRAPIVAV